MNAEDGADREALLALDPGPAQGQVPGAGVDRTAGQDPLHAGGGLDDGLVPLLEPAMLSSFLMAALLSESRPSVLLHFEGAKGTIPLGVIPAMKFPPRKSPRWGRS